MARRTLLLIEDEESIAEPLQLALEREGFEVVWAATAATGLEAFQSREPEVVLLDVMLPDGDGRDVLRELRSVSAVPVIMLTARGQEIDRVLGLRRLVRVGLLRLRVRRLERQRLGRLASGLPSLNPKPGRFLPNSSPGFPGAS